jgi:hypothetical protein
LDRRCQIKHVSLTQSRFYLPLSNEHGSQIKDQSRRQCCHNKRKIFPHRPTRDVSLFPDTPRTCFGPPWPTFREHYKLYKTAV